MLFSVNRSTAFSSTSDRSRVARVGLAALLLGLGSLLCGALASAGPLPPLPDPNAPPAPSSTSPAPDPASPAGPSVLLERARRGVVTIEQNARTVALGTVLNGDGRILTELTALGAAEQVDVRYADGSTLRAKVAHRNKTWDLAMLVPISGRWTEGLVPSGVHPSGVALSAYVVRANRPALVAAAFKDSIDARSRDSEPLAGAYDVELKGAQPTPGSPLLDGTGGVLGIFVQACKLADGGPCVPFIVAVPAHVLRTFCVHAPASAVIPQPWLGIRGEADSAGNVRGVRVVALATNSPAEKGGLKANLERSLSDLIVAVDSHPVDTPEKLQQELSKHAVGEGVKFLVYNGDRFRELVVTLGSAP